MGIPWHLRFNISHCSMHWFRNVGIVTFTFNLKDILSTGIINRHERNPSLGIEEYMSITVLLIYCMQVGISPLDGLNFRLQCTRCFFSLGSWTYSFIVRGETHIHIYTYTYTHTHIHVHTHIYIHTYTNMYVYIYMYIYIYTQPYVYIYI